jgi:DNA-binding winged helix-turn-helix (wHTH) protein
MPAPAALPVSTPPRRLLAFGSFTFDPVAGLLRRSGVEVPLPPRVLGVLRLLVDHAGDVVDKQTLITAVWRDAFVTETSLAEAVSVLRQALGDDPQRPQYVQTQHRRGYRFIAEVEVTDDVPRLGTRPGGDRGPAGVAAVVDDVAEAPVPTDSHDACETSTAVAADSPVAAAEPAPRLSLVVPWIAALLTTLIAASALWELQRIGRAPAPPVVRFSLALPAGVTLSSTGAPIALSPDGRMVAVVACESSGCALHLRALSQAAFTAVAGTTGAAAPFFSADGQSLGYFAGGRLWTLRVNGGAPQAVADAPEALGAAWLGDGRIVFARSDAEGLFVVRPGVGDVVPFTTAAAEGGHRWPVALPDDRGVAFTVHVAPTGARDYAAIASLGSGTWNRAIDDVSAARVLARRYLVASRGDALVAAWFDAATRAPGALPAAVPFAPLAPVPPVPAGPPLGELTL